MQSGAQKQRACQRTYVRQRTDRRQRFLNVLTGVGMSLGWCRTALKPFSLTPAIDEWAPQIGFTLEVSVMSLATDGLRAQCEDFSNKRVGFLRFHRILRVHS